jgi:hypothetical protein
MQTGQSTQCSMQQWLDSSLTYGNRVSGKLNIYFVIGEDKLKPVYSFSCFYSNLLYRQYFSFLSTVILIINCAQ